MRYQYTIPTQRVGEHHEKWDKMQCKSGRVVTCCEMLPSGCGVMSSPESTSAVVVWIKPTHDQGGQTQVQREEKHVRLYTQL